MLIASSPLLILIFLTSSCLVTGQGRKPGSCRTDIQYLQSVGRAAFEGIWFMQRGRALNEERAFRCGRMDYEYLYTKPEEIGYRARNFKISTVDRTSIANIGSLKFPSRWEGQFRIKYWPTANPGAEAIDWENLRYKVLTLDCDTLIIYACQNFEEESEHAELVWVYTRQPHPLDTIENAYTAALTAKGIDVGKLYKIRHTFCRNYGIPQAAAPQ
ncbi:uncharacterized protein [Eurosta solidaginis]|uniref:uncharacterized protein n=1 Tax=Eurosta solidaginis TaxID=178769 RepID=UPI0035313AD1